eukprot:scaffold135802_cov31-Tisochrysis_lutea.AAC.2
MGCRSLSASPSNTASSPICCMSFGSSMRGSRCATHYQTPRADDGAPDRSSHILCIRVCTIFRSLSTSAMHAPSLLTRRATTPLMLSSMTSKV